MRRLIEWFVEDTKKDLEFLKKLHKGEANIKKRSKELLNIGWMFKNGTFFLFILVFAVVFCAGFFLGEQKMAIKCQNILNNVTRECQEYCGGNNFFLVESVSPLLTVANNVSSDYKTDP